MKKAVKLKKVETNIEKEQYVNSVWKVLKEGYSNVKGGLYFKSKKDLIDQTAYWKVVLYRDRVVAVTVYKVKKGLKLVALSTGNKYREVALNVLRRVIKRDLKKCWMELSEAAEKFVLRLGGDRYIIPNDIVEKILEKNIQLVDDGVHYIREIMGLKKEKILVGTIRLG